MSLLRSEQQLVLNDVLVAFEKSVDHYRDAANFLSLVPPGETLRRIARERDRLVQRLIQAVHAAGDLPSVPDEDRESVEKLYHRLHAGLSRDEVKDVLQQRLEAERALGDTVAEARGAGWADNQAALLGDLERHVQAATARLQDLLQSHG
jgi:hypothetical protein